MVCENDFCLYNKNGKCSLENVSIDNLGTCENCILVTLNENVLEGRKAQQLQEMENR